MEMTKYKLGDLIAPEKKSLISGPFGSNISSKYFVEKGIPVIRGNNLNIGYEKFNDSGYVFITKEKAEELDCWAQIDDLIFTAAGTLGQVGIITDNLSYKEFVISNKQIRARLNKKVINVLYAYYWCSSPWIRAKLKNNDKGSTVPLLTLAEIRELPVYLPEDLQKQNRIVNVLESLSKKIALNRRMNAKLEEMAKRLYDHWFVQFDFPNADGKPYKASCGKMVWNETLKREIPEGWEVGKVSDLLECDISGDWGEEEIKGNHKYKVNCIRGCDMVDMINLPVRYILESNSKKLLQKDDFVIEISGGSPTQSTGRIVQITDEILKRFNGKIICSNFCHGIRLNDKDYVSYFLQMWNMFYLNNIFFNYEGKTSGLKNFQFDTFVSESWYVPPKELARKYHNVVSDFRKQIDKNESETQKLIVLRDRLLPLLMNGQVEVK